ncbi:HAD family hydrolase [Kiloniella laminariae]|uniref:HAD family hydrolase n=1 Tax=Kiloniella laminariae TaxID=454162 RepID=UPI00036360F7|nr:HAD-IB family hydrolase [Kiloniella laminariae]
MNDMSDRGAASYAFFDVDDTLINVKSMFSFQDYWYSLVSTPEEQEAFGTEMGRLRAENAPWEILNRRYYSYFAGRSVSQVADCAEQWFLHLERTVEDLFHTAIIEKLGQHQAKGDVPVFVSGSFPAALAPSARRFGVEHILATTMEVTEGRYTGEILPPQTIGAGKAEAVAGFLAKTQVPATACYAYGDDISDLPMLEAVGHPFVVSGGRGLEEHARKVGWPVLSPR